MADECSIEGGGRTEIGYRLGGLFGVLVGGLIGFVLPFIFKDRFKFTFFVVQNFAAGIVFAVGMVHILPEADAVFKNPCLGLNTEFPWVYVVTLLAALFTFIMEHSLKLVIKASTMQSLHQQIQANSGGSLESGQFVGKVVETDEEVEHRNHRVIAYTLESGIIFHSIFVGLTLGTARDTTFVQALAFALVFHQGFEGIPLGAAISKAKLGFWKVVFLGTMFTLTCPFGVALGMGFWNSYNENSKPVLVVTGIFNSLSAGILIYNSLVDLLLPAYEESKDEENPRSVLQTMFGFVSLLAGGASMSFIAKWA